MLPELEASSDERSALTTGEIFLLKISISRSSVLSSKLALVARGKQLLVYDSLFNDSW